MCNFSFTAIILFFCVFFKWLETSNLRILFRSNTLEVVKCVTVFWPATVFMMLCAKAMMVIFMRVGVHGADKLGGRSARRGSSHRQSSSLSSS